MDAQPQLWHSRAAPGIAAGQATIRPMSQDPAEAPLPEIAQRISREQMNDLPIGRYEGPVHLVATPEDLQRAMHQLRQEEVLGFDTETRPAFRPGESYLPSLVQFATA